MANSNSERMREGAAEGEQSQADHKSAPTIAHMLGEIVWVLAQSPAHKHFSLADLEWLVVPPLMLEQYRVFRDDKNAPIGVALWAFLDETAEKQLETEPARLRPDQWDSGDKLWLVELVAPFSNSQSQLRERVLADLASKIFVGKTVKYHGFDAASGRRVTREFKGRQPDRLFS